MSKELNRRFARGAIAVVGLGILTASALVAVVAAGGGRSLPADVQAARSELARYHSVDNALADGYVPVSPCEASPAGTMGIHYANMSLFGPGNDPARPELLLYLPRQDGSLEFVAAEYFQVDADQNLGTDGDRPSIFGQPFNGPMLGHNPQMPIHYDLHVWLTKHNPSGLFAQWNPAISCP
jgi:hypothetical protein